MLNRLLTRGARALLPATATLSLGLVSVFGAGAAQAAPIEFVIDDIDVVLSDIIDNCSAPTCTPQFTVNAPETFTLDRVIGDTTDVDLFTVLFEGRGAFFLQTESAILTTTVSFSSPSPAVANDPISGFGVFATSIIGKAAGIEFITRTTEVNFSDGTSISLNFPDRVIPILDDLGLPTDDGDACFGRNCSLSVTVGTTARLEEIPEPASVLLLGAGLAGLGVVRRRRSAAKAA